jgi:hypothetical protein
VDVEPELGRAVVPLFLVGGEEVGQDGGQTGASEFGGDVPVAWAVAAAAAAVREQHHAAGPFRHGDVSLERDTRDRDLQTLLQCWHRGTPVDYTANG